MTQKLDLTGQKFGRLTIIHSVPNIGKWTAWSCRCDCGKEKVTTTNRLKSGNTLSCGCIRRGDGHPRFINRIGKQYGRLTVLSRELNRGKRIPWLCQCVCGNKIVVDGAHLTSGHTRSCGCLPTRGKRLAKGEAAFNQLFHSYKMNAVKRHKEFSLSKEEFRKIVKQPCSYCGCLPSTYCGYEAYGKFTYNGVDRFDNSKGYVSGNIVACCFRCNTAKNTMSYYEFIEHCWKIADRHPQKLF